MNTVLFSIVVAFALGSAMTIGHVSMRPLGDAIKRVSAPIRFSTADLIWLGVLIQVAAALWVSMVRGSDLGDANWLLLGLLITASLAIWVCGVSTMARAGVTSTWRRGIFTLVMLPVIVAQLMGAIFLVGGVTAVIGMGVLLWTRRDFGDLQWSNRLDESEMFLVALIAVIAGWGAVIGMILPVRLTLRWLIQARRSDTSPAANS